MCTFKAYGLEITLLDIQTPSLTSREHLLKFSGPSTKGDLQNSPYHIRSINVHIQSLHACQHTSTYSNPRSVLQQAFPEIFRPLNQRRPLEQSVHVGSSNVHTQSLHAGEHTSRESKPCSDVQEASSECFRSFFQRRPLEESVQIRSYVHTQSIHV